MTLTGLTTTDAQKRAVLVGRNELPSAEHRTHWQIVGAVLREPMLLLLLVATGLYVAFGDITEAGALGVSVLAIVTITLLQERRSERALDALRELASPHCRVLRDGAWSELDVRELVPGDVIQVGEGDRAPADALLRIGAPLTIDESLLTGESVPVVRTPDPAATTLGRAGELGASVFAGTLVTSGNALAEVLRTGAATEVGRIGAALGSIEIARAPLHQEIVRVVRRVAFIALGISTVLGLVYILVGHGWRQGVLAAITLAMSLLPEELPLVLTVFLTLGAWRIARHRVLTRRAAAIETLGAVTVLCVDKTGTLTVNQMAIRRIEADGAADVDADASALPESMHEVIEYGLLACPRQTTDAMDRAFAALAERTLRSTEHLHPRWDWVREYPLTPGLLAVTHVWRDDVDHVVVATKGAPEAIIDLCHLDDVTAARWRARAEAMAADGLRVLGVARARHAAATFPDNPHDYEFEIIGMVGLADPLRADTAETIATCHAAGVRVVMITGDHPLTARAIARSAGLRSDDVLTGPELETLDASALADRLRRVDVVARAAPAHKLRIIDALRTSGEVVGMTGDGVNDAPALKAADVGIAMGRGTQVAREAAGLVLLEDSLASIVASIRTGRTIYDNLKKVAAYLFAVHVPIAGLALVPPLAGWPLLLAPVHIVLLELVIDPTCSVVFELEPPGRDVMQRPPRGRSEHLFQARRVAYALLLGLAALVGPLALIAAAQGAQWTDGATRAVGFLALVAADLALVFATRADLHAGRNPAIRWMVVAIVGLVAMIVAIPWLRELFQLASIEPIWIVVAAAVGIVPVLGVSAARSLRRRGDTRVLGAIGMGAAGP